MMATTHHWRHAYQRDMSSVQGNMTARVPTNQLRENASAPCLQNTHTNRRLYSPAGTSNSDALMVAG